MANVTALDVIKAGSIVEAFESGPFDWVRMSGIMGMLLVVTAVLVVASAQSRARRSALRRLIACLVAALALGVGGTYIGGMSAAAVINRLKMPFPNDVAVGGTASLETAILGAFVALVAVAFFALAWGRAEMDEVPRPRWPILVAVVIGIGWIGGAIALKSRPFEKPKPPPASPASPAAARREPRRIRPRIERPRPADPAELEREVEEAMRVGVAKMDAGDFDGAIAAFSDMIDLRPEVAQGWLTRGAARAVAGDPAGAAEDATEAIQLAPGLSVAYWSRGNARLDLEDWDGAIADFSDAIRLGIRPPQLGTSYSRRARAKLQKGDAAGAAADFEEAKRVEAAAGGR